MGTPQRARATCTSSLLPSTWSGEAAVTTVEIRGRSRNRSRSPDMTSQRRMTASTSVGQSTKVTCIEVSVSIVKYSTSSRRSSGTSVALTCVHMRSICGNSSMSAVHSRRSWSVLGRRTPVRKSSVLATQPLGAKWKSSLSPSRTSSSGVAPAITNDRGHCVMAHSTRSRGSFAMPLASSTWAPRAARNGSISEPAKRMPVVASSSIAWSAMRLFSGSLSHVVVAFMRAHLRGPEPSAVPQPRGDPGLRPGHRPSGQWHPVRAVSSAERLFATLIRVLDALSNARTCFRLWNRQ